jgi:osmoprotectant transport system permease protein
MELFSYLIENFSFILEKTWQHFLLFLVSWLAAVVVGITIGIFSTRPGKEKIGRIVLSLTGATQAIPSTAVIALVFIFMGIGSLPAMFALFLYSLVPITFNTASGLLNVSPDMKEAATGIGMTKNQILWHVELPTTIPAISSGMRTAAIINIGTAAVASIIGAGGLGEVIFIGLRLMDVSKIFAGALPVSILAILVDIFLGFLEKRIMSEGLILSKGK